MKSVDNTSKTELDNGWPEWLTTTDHIGSHYPYYYEGGNKKYRLSFRKSIEEISPEKRILDTAAVAEILGRGYPLGNRTLVRGLKKVPWMAKPADGEWCRHQIPKHDTRTPNAEDIESELRSALKREVLNYASEVGEIGILLSGGMDSRIVAGIVRQLKESGQLSGNVIALTWGLEKSRDVKYAREIARRYDWSIRHYEITPELLLENIYTMGRIGAEGPPHHLHALPRIRKESSLDVILSGSYGNSIGRGLYSDDKVESLDPIVPKWINSFGVLRQNVLDESHENILNDAYSCRNRLSRSFEYQYREIEYQRHYMRRGLQAWMTYVSEKTPIFQVFTSPNIVKLMWGLDSEVRDDRYYHRIVSSLPKNIGEIPYAKTGLPFGADKGTADDGFKNHHKYGRWLRNELRSEVIKLLKKDGIWSLNIFNKKSVNRLLKLWPKYNTKTENKVDNIISWMASLSVMLDEYDISSKSFQSNMRDGINSVVGPAHAVLYLTAREFVRK
ncbi:asparagine synthase-related protein [Salinibacter sp.]|uniref:asparagine synthase-related protein n=1 Tax=Salinibacter sp. TaxID=2065818 RepID=UPI0021E6F29D|nr:asparagine synthase-related protein [Salinibacter sp.]